jgi:SAM-dependent methyltransferase
MPSHDPSQRFTGKADCYARCRPDYPPAAIDFITTQCRIGPGSLLVDVGCGTGISSRLFAERGLRVIGIEPNDDMRRRAESERAVSQVEFRSGAAEATGLPDDCADAVLAAQAFHWFDPDRALAEFHRVLKPHGGIALMWNERDESDPFTAGYGQIVGASAEAKAVEGKRLRAGAALLTHPLYTSAARTVFRHEQVLDEAGVVGRATSATYAPREPADLLQFKLDLHAVFARFQQAGVVILRYETSVYTAVAS